MDGLSVLEDIIEGTRKKSVDEDEIENIDIYFPDVFIPNEFNYQSAPYDCIMSKGNEDDFEEEKIHTTPKKHDKEKFLLHNFQDEDFLMDFDHVNYDIPMIGENALLRTISHKTDRCMSLLNDEPIPFILDYKKNKEISFRERSFSKCTETEWYDRDWRNAVPNEQSLMIKTQQPSAQLVEEEHEYFKQFDDVLMKQASSSPSCGFVFSNE